MYFDYRESNDVFTIGDRRFAASHFESFERIYNNNPRLRFWFNKCEPEMGMLAVCGAHTLGIITGITKGNNGRALWIGHHLTSKPTNLNGEKGSRWQSVKPIVICYIDDMSLLAEGIV